MLQSTLRRQLLSHLKKVLVGSSVSMVGMLTIGVTISDVSAECPSRRIDFSGVLDSGATITTIPGGTPTFSQLSASATFSNFLDVEDDLGVTRTMILFFFKTASFEYSVRPFVDGSTIAGGSAGEAVALNTIVDPLLVFSAGGQLDAGASTTLFDVKPSITSPYNGWINGATRSPITLAFAGMTTTAGPSAISAAVITRECPPPVECPTAPTLPSGARVSRDFDGDDIDDLVVYDYRRRTFRIVLSASNTTISRPFPARREDEKPIAGDFLGDKKPEVALYSAKRNQWNICTNVVASNCLTPTTIGFGRRGDVPMSGDYDGDGKLDVAVFRKRTGKVIYRTVANATEHTLLGTVREGSVMGTLD